MRFYEHRNLFCAFCVGQIRLKNSVTIKHVVRKVVLEALRRALAAGHTDGQHAQRLIFLLNTSQA